MIADPYIIRPATPQDADALGALSRQAFTETFVDEFKIGYSADDLAAFLDKSHSPQAFAKWLIEPDTGAWVAESDGALAGYALCGDPSVPHPDIGPGDVELHRLYVLKPWHGTGVARDLMATAMAWMERFSVQWLGVWSGNVRAQKFYARYGFEKAGEYDYPVGRTLDREFILRRRPNEA
jgi:ribosomal protein S18 acetylase RimI-like enzyme